MLDFCRRKLSGKTKTAATAQLEEQLEQTVEPTATRTAPFAEQPGPRPGRPARRNEQYERNSRNSRQDNFRHEQPRGERRPARNNDGAGKSGPKLNPDHQSKVLPGLKVITRDQHGVSRKDISPNALKVLYRLKDAGFEAYLVGGCIRDLLLGLKPKDFDVVTNAHPDEVRGCV